MRASLAGQAHLWVSAPEIWTEERTREFLTGAELDRARTLRHPVAQQNYLAGRALVRAALSHYLDLDPKKLSFGASRFGRPELDGPEPIPELRFNLTHTPGLAACVITRTADCGVDAEEVDRPLRPLRIAEHSFAPEELGDLEHRSPEDLRARFFAYWTLKEAYYKARGSGIPFRLGGARFELPSGGRIRFLPADDENVRAESWQFFLFRPKPEHLLAVALEPGERRLELRCFGHGSEGQAAAFAPLALPAERTTEPVPA